MECSFYHEYCVTMMICFGTLKQTIHSISKQSSQVIFIYIAHLKTAHADQSALQLNHNKIKYQNK